MDSGILRIVSEVLPPDTTISPDAINTIIYLLGDFFNALLGLSEHQLVEFIYSTRLATIPNILEFSRENSKYEAKLVIEWFLINMFEKIDESLFIENASDLELYKEDYYLPSDGDSSSDEENDLSYQLGNLNIATKDLNIVKLYDINLLHIYQSIVEDEYLEQVARSKIIKIPYNVPVDISYKFNKSDVNSLGISKSVDKGFVNGLTIIINSIELYFMNPNHMSEFNSFISIFTNYNILAKVLADTADNVANNSNELTLTYKHVLWAAHAFTQQSVGGLPLTFFTHIFTVGYNRNLVYNI